MADYYGNNLHYFDKAAGHAIGTYNPDDENDAQVEIIGLNWYEGYENYCIVVETSDGKYWYIDNTGDYEIAYVPKKLKWDDYEGWIIDGKKPHEIPNFWL